MEYLILDGLVMKKITQVLTAVAALGFVGLTHAENPVSSTTGQVTFTGKVYSQTCRVADKSKDLKVVLEDVRASSLLEAGKVAGSQNFILELLNCTAGTVAGLKFDPVNVDANTGTLKNVKKGKGAAENVNIQLSVNGTPINLANLNKDAYQEISKDDLTTQYKFAASYYATGKATAGDVESFVTFKVDYK